MMNKKIYVIGSLRNPRVPEIGASLRQAGYDAFDEWYASGPETDDYWQKYEQQRERPYHEAIRSPYARNVFEFDRQHILESQATVLVMPAGKSAFLELGYSLGMGKGGFILLDGEPERYEIMFQFATGIATNPKELLRYIDSYFAEPSDSPLKYAHGESPQMSLRF
jgi:hypothetical protein